ncbi:MAG TPA: ABC transporter ATP-binding protein [Xanthobacteraceae bacterium]|nr:ABC transporter ATP-binding protein [Xanthobacteraceae bacterium]
MLDPRSYPKSDSEAPPLLEVRRLSARYGLAQVLFGISLDVRRGEIVALMGRNGAGKSTTLKAIMGLVTADCEHMTFAGRDIAGLSPFRIARLGLGYVPEERRIFADLTVFENLEVGRRSPRGAGREPSNREPWTLERLFTIFPNLAEMRGRRASAISGGEQQMLTIARTLMGNPDMVLLDEPSEGLAPVIVEQMADAVLRMKDAGLAVLLSEQNLHFAAAVCDRAVVIEKGAVRYEGTIEALEADEAVRESYLTV